MEHSFILHSSMSPKMLQHKKHSHKQPTTKLALKKNLRRSSVYDKKAEISKLIVVSSSTNESSSSSSSAGRKYSSTSPIIISDSDSGSSSADKAEADYKKNSSCKTDEIETWIKNVSLECDNRKTSLYSGEPSISQKTALNTESFAFDGKKSKERDSFENLEESSDVSFKSFMKNQFEKFNKLNQSSGKDGFESSMVLHGSNNKSTGNAKPLQNSASGLERAVALNNSSDIEDEAAGVLDELYGNSWRENKVNILTYSELRNKKQPFLASATAKTERKPQLYGNPYMDSERAKSNSLLQSLHKTQVEAALMSPFMTNLKNLCNSDSDSVPENNAKITRKKLDFNETSDKENTSILDEDDLNHRTRRKVNAEQNVEVDLYNLDQEQLGKTGSDSRNTKPQNSCNFSDNESLNGRKENDFENHTRKKLYRKKINAVHVDCDKPEKKKSGSTIQNSCSSSSSSDADDGDHWWKPSRKSLFKLYEQRETTKTFSFLASLSDTVPPHQAVPAALIFRSDFKSHRDALVRKLFEMYNRSIFQNAIPEDTPIKWNTRMRGTAGYCYCRRAVKNGEVIKRSVRIELSTKVVDCAERVRDTLVHEMCHAATWMVNNVSNGHGSYWKGWADKALRIFPELPPIRRCHDYQINTKYTYRCVSCGYSIGRHTKSLDIEKKRCGHCYGKFEVLLNKQTKEGKVKSVVSTPKKTTGFALFVKEHYATMKAPNLSHGDVMKLLGQKFSELKVAELNK